MGDVNILRVRRIFRHCTAYSIRALPNVSEMRDTDPDTTALRAGYGAGRDRAK
jgi:hypothetical protein